MDKKNAICIHVQDGNIIHTSTQVRIRLARVIIPKLDTTRGKRARNMLKFMIGKRITYEQVHIDFRGYIVAECRGFAPPPAALLRRRLHT